MDDCCALPATPPPAGAAGVREQIELLRRFHLGDPRARPAAIPATTLPAALHPLRGAPAAGDWPLIIDPSAGGAPFARSLGAWLGGAQETAGALAERLGQLAQRITAGVDDSVARPAREIIRDAAGQVADDLGLAGEERSAVLAAADGLVAGLDGAAVLVGFGPRAVPSLCRLAAERRHRLALVELTAVAAGLVESIDELLERDRARRPGTAPGAGGAAASGATDPLGPLGSRLMDPTRFSAVIAHRRTDRVLTDDRYRQLEATKALLAGLADHSAAPIWLTWSDAQGDGAAGKTAARTAGKTGREPSPASMPAAAIEAAGRRFDAAAEACLPLVRALRHARLEVAQAFEPDKHEPWLERLDWRSFDPLELALIPAVFVTLTSEELLDRELPALTRLLLSGRPVQIQVERAAPTPGAATGFEPGLLGVIVGRSFVHQGSVAAGVALAEGIERGLAAARPALHLFETAPAASHGLDSWWVAWARLAGRAMPGFVHDPARGTSWASRFDLEVNPAALDDWPEQDLSDELSAAGAPQRAPFTFVESALLDPAWHPHFAAAPESTDLVPFNEWITRHEPALRSLPYIWAAAAAGGPVRLVISRELARAALERLEFWRTLGELAGSRSDHLAAVIAETRRQEEAQASFERSALETRHADELERLRQSGDSAAVERLVHALIGLGSTASGNRQVGNALQSDPEGGGIP